MISSIRSAISRAAAHARESRFGKPAARIVLIAAGLSGFAAIGHLAGRGELGALAAPALASDSSPTATAASSGAAAAHAKTQGAGIAGPDDSATSLVAVIPAQAASLTQDSTQAHRTATADDPVILNTASIEDLRRLPGIGQKRAMAILELRQRLGRLRALEDLLRVKGIGRATLKRLRPLVRLDAKPLDAKPAVDAGV